MKTKSVDKKSSKKIVASIEARMTSTRLPGKVLMKVLEKPMLELLVERIRKSKYIDDIVVATTTNKPDDAIAETAEKIGIKYFRGDEENVVKRVTEAMEWAKADVVVQLTGDNPLVDNDIIDLLIEKYLSGEHEMVANNLTRSYPYGMDTRVASLQLLQESLRIAKDKPHFEHLFFSIIESAENYKLHNISAPEELRRPEYRLTLDTKEDFELISKVFENLHPKNPDFKLKDIISFLEENPEIIEINKKVVQKKPRQKAR